MMSHEEHLQIEDAPAGQPGRRQHRAPATRTPAVLLRPLPSIPHKIVVTKTQQDAAWPQLQPPQSEHCTSMRQDLVLVQDKKPALLDAGRSQSPSSAPGACERLERQVSPRSDERRLADLVAGTPRATNGDVYDADIMTDGYRDRDTESHQCPLYQAAGGPTNDSIVPRGSCGGNSGQVAKRIASSRKNVAQGGKRLLAALVCCARRPTTATVVQGMGRQYTNP